MIFWVAILNLSLKKLRIISILLLKLKETQFPSHWSGLSVIYLFMYLIF